MNIQYVDQPDKGWLIDNIVLFVSPGEKSVLLLEEFIITFWVT